MPTSSNENSLPLSSEKQTEYFSFDPKDPNLDPKFFLPHERIIFLEQRLLNLERHVNELRIMLVHLESSLRSYDDGK